MFYRVAYCCFRNVPDANLLTDTSFVEHVTRFMDFLDFICSNLDSLNCMDDQTNNDRNSVCQRLLLLGATHARLGVVVTLTHMHVLCEAMHCVWESVCGEEYSEEVRAAWTLLFDFITLTFTEGHSMFTKAMQTDAAELG